MSAWTPEQIASATLAAWYQASDVDTITLNGATVAQWDDKSSAGRNLAQATASLQPAYTDNAVVGDGASKTMVASVSGVSDGTQNAYTIFAVVTPAENQASIPAQSNSGTGFYTAGTVWNIPLTVNGNTGTTSGPVSPVLSISGNAIGLTETRNSLAPCNISRAASIGIGTKGCVCVKRTSAAALSSSVNFEALVGATTGAVVGLSWTGLIIPANYAVSANYFNGSIHEIAIVFGNLSTDEMDRMEGYLAWNNGLEGLLPSDHLYKDYAPEIGGTMVPVAASLDQLWGDAPLVAVQLDQPWSIRIGADLLQPWSNAPVIKGVLSQPWGNAGVVRAQLVQRWREMVTLRARLDQPWAIMASLLVALEQPWAITSGPVQALLDQGWGLKDIEPVLAVLHQPWAIAADGTVLRYTVTVFANGQPVRVSHVNIEGGLDESGDVLSCEIHVQTEAEYLLCPFGTGLQVKITSQEGTDVFVFVVTDPHIDDQHGSTSYVIEAMSPAVLLGAPYADVIDGEFSGLASEIAASLAGSLSISWETVDWRIPAASWIASGETPLALLKTLAAAVGAVVQSDPDGAIAIRPRYPVSLPKWETIIADLSLTETLDCFTNGSTPDHRYGYNRFLVSNQSSSADSLTLEQIDITSTVKEVRGYQVPWDGLFELTHTGGPWVVIESLGIEEREETETVEFVAGAGTTQYPVYGLVTVDWQQNNLGTITTAEDGSLTSAITGQSLCAITYLTRCRLWRVTDPQEEQLQLVIEV
nr:hypothetical protein [uncultured Desulfobulbus sp.]